MGKLCHLRLTFSSNEHAGDVNWVFVLLCKLHRITWPVGVVMTSHISFIRHSCASLINTKDLKCLILMESHTQQLLPFVYQLNTLKELIKG